MNENEVRRIAREEVQKALAEQGGFRLTSAHPLFEKVEHGSPTQGIPAYFYGKAEDASQ